MDCEGVEEEGWKFDVEEEEAELKVEELDCVGFGCTGPRVWRRAARSGSEASRLIALFTKYVRFAFDFRY